MSYNFFIVLKKELKDAIRDRRSVMAALSYSIGTPLIMCLVFIAMIDKFSSPEALYIDIVGQDRAPGLVRHLAGADIHSGVNIKEDQGSMKDITLTIDDDYQNNLRRGLPAKILIQADFSNESLKASISRLQREINGFTQELGAIRLLARGVTPGVVRPIDIEVEDMARPEAKGGFIIGVALFTMIYSVFISGMNLAIDTSAGERERNSLALMLSLPIRASDLVLGKLLAVACFALLGLLLITLSSKIAYSFVPWQELGVNVNLSFGFIVLLLLVCMPLAFLAAVMQLFVSFMAKTFKEAQSYLTIVLIVPMGMAMVTGYNIGPDVLKWLPVSGQQKALMEVVKGNVIPWDSLLVATAVTFLMTLGLAAGLVKMLKREQTVFGL